MNDISKLANQIKEKYGLETFDLNLDKNGDIELVMLQVPRDKRKLGAGSAAMKALTDYADRTGALIWLSVADRDPSTGTTSKQRLVKFYRRFGFVPNKGRNKRFDLSMYANMYREPKGVKEEIKDIKRRAGLRTDEARTAPLYHWMDGQKALNVFQNDVILPSWEHILPNTGESIKGTSATRNKKFRFNDYPIRITLDQDRLSRTNKIIPVDADRVWSHTMVSKYGNRGRMRNLDPENTSTRTEYSKHPQFSMDEEFIIGPIRPLHKYVTMIEINANTAGDLIRQNVLNAIRQYAKKYSIPLRDGTINESSNNYPPQMSADQIFDYVSDLHHTPDDMHEGDLDERIQAYGEYQLTNLPMDSVDHEEWDIDDDLVDEYVEQFKISPDYPPIVFDPEARSIIDGTHRANALHQLGAKTIRAYVGIPQSARTFEDMNSIMGMDDIDEEIGIILRRAGLDG